MVSLSNHSSAERGIENETDLYPSAIGGLTSPSPVTIVVGIFCGPGFLPVKTARGHGTRATTLLEGLDVRSFLWLAMMGVMLVVLLLPFSSYVAALPLIQDEWGLNNTQAGAIFSAYLAVSAVSALLIIPLADRLGPRHIFLASAALSVVAHALFPLVANDMASGAILRALAGVGLVGVYMPGLRMISERYATYGRGMAIDAFVTAYYAANSASLATTGALMSVLDWRDAYLVMALASAASLPLAYALLRNRRYTSGGRSTGRLDLSVLKNRAARLLILGYSIHGLQLHAVRVWLSVFLVAVLVARSGGSRYSCDRGSLLPRAQ